MNIDFDNIPSEALDELITTAMQVRKERVYSNMDTYPKPTWFDNGVDMVAEYRKATGYSLVLSHTIVSYYRDQYMRHEYEQCASGLH